MHRGGDDRAGSALEHASGPRVWVSEPETAVWHVARLVDHRSRRGGADD
jgi:hypothetical protein